MHFTFQLPPPPPPSPPPPPPPPPIAPKSAAAAAAVKAPNMTISPSLLDLSPVPTSQGAWESGAVGEDRHSAAGSRRLGPRVSAQQPQQTTRRRYSHPVVTMAATTEKNTQKTMLPAYIVSRISTDAENARFKISYIIVLWS